MVFGSAKIPWLLAAFVLLGNRLGAQTPVGPGQPTASQSTSPELLIPLQVHAGRPLRLYLTHKARFRQGETVQGRLIEPVWVFDRIAVPSNALVSGHIAQLAPAPKMVRTMSIVRGDFTPLKRAAVTFDSLTLAGGPALSIETEPALGLNSIYAPPRATKKTQKTHGHAKPPSNSKAAQADRFLKQQAMVQANARSRGFLDFVRTRNRREWLEDFFWAKLPWHPQWYRTGTRFDVLLARPLDFGVAKVPAAVLQTVGSAPPPDTPAVVQLENTVSSADAKVGDPIAGELSQPLFNTAQQLVLPAGSELKGKVTFVRRARMFHRGGQLRFAFNSVKPGSLPALAAAPPRPAMAQLTGAESSAGAAKVDEEGTAKATESKTRLLRPVVAGLVAAKSLDNDEGRPAASGGASANYGGRSLGGFSGFGLFGTALSYGPRYIGSAFGFYGLAWSVYATVISRGHEVTFEKNSALAIRFGTAPRAPAKP